MAQVKFLKIAGNVPTEHTGSADDLTVLSLSSDTISERTGAAGVTVDSLIIKDGGLTTGVGGNIAFNAVTNTIAGIENQNLLDKSAVETVSGAWTFSDDLKLYQPVNDGNPILKIGAVDAEELNIQAIYDLGAQTLNYVLFQTDVASATADKGLYRFNVDGSNIMDIDDGGIVVTGDVSGTTIGGITEANLVDKSAAESITGAWDFSGATSLAIPAAEDPTVNANGEIAIDTNANLAGNIDRPLLTYYANSIQMWAIGVDALPSTDGYVLKYDAANDKFIFAQESDPVVSDLVSFTYDEGVGPTTSKGDVLYMKATNNTVARADADTISQGDTIIGITNDAGPIAQGASVNVFVTRGKVITGALSGATAGTVMYLSATPGPPTATPPSGGPALVKVGIAKNATDLIFCPEFIADTTA